MIIINLKQNKMKQSKKSLINQIWLYCKNTHSEQDYKDLFNFSMEELEEILSDIEFDIKHY